MHESCSVIKTSEVDGQSSNITYNLDSKYLNFTYQANHTYKLVVSHLNSSKAQDSQYTVMILP